MLLLLGVGIATSKGKLDNMSWWELRIQTANWDMEGVYVTISTSPQTPNS